MRRARVDEPLENVLGQGVLRVRRQLAVRERARAALAELDVGGGVERPSREERVDGLDALLDACATLDHEGPKPRLREVERRAQSGRARPHDDRARLPGCAGRRPAIGDVEGAVGLVQLCLNALRRRSLSRDALLVFCVCQGHAQRRDKVHVALLARVDAALEDDDVDDLVLAHPGRLRGDGTQEALALQKARVEGKFHVRKLKHG